MTTEFYRSLHLPAYDPPIEELDAIAGVGWRLTYILVTPPQNKYAVEGLLVIWSRDIPDSPPAPQDNPPLWTPGRRLIFFGIIGGIAGWAIIGALVWIFLHLLRS